MDDDATGDKRLVLYLDIPRQKGTTRDHNLAAQNAVVRNMSGGHDEIVVADHGGGFGLCGPRNCEVLANLVVIPDLQIAALTSEIFIERIGAQYGGSTDFIAFSEACPALDVNVWLENAVGPKGDILLDNAVFSNLATACDVGVMVYSRRGCYTRTRVYGHK